jgi:hypothetical protein
MTKHVSQEQRRLGNARTSSAKARKKQEPTEIDWDAAQQRLKAMLDDIDRKYGKRP